MRSRLVGGRDTGHPQPSRPGTGGSVHSPPPGRSLAGRHHARIRSREAPPPPMRQFAVHVFRSKLRQMCPRTFLLKIADCWFRFLAEVSPVLCEEGFRPEPANRLSVALFSKNSPAATL